MVRTAKIKPGDLVVIEGTKDAVVGTVLSYYNNTIILEAELCEVIGPHGSPENELALMKAGKKPAVLMLDYHFDKLYKPIIDKMGWEVVKFTGPEHTSYVVAQHGDRARAEKIAKLVSDASKIFATGKKVDPNYHRELGTLLGYSKEDIEHFISNIYGDKNVSEGDVIKSKFISRQLEKNKTPYKFNQDIADRIPMYDPKRRYGTYHKTGHLRRGDEVPFDHFKVREKHNQIAEIVGVTQDGNEIVVSVTQTPAAYALVDAYNRGGFTDKDIKLDESEQHKNYRVYVTDSTTNDIKKLDLDNFNFKNTNQPRSFLTKYGVKESTVYWNCNTFYNDTLKNLLKELGNMRTNDLVAKTQQPDPIGKKFINEEFSFGDTIDTQRAIDLFGKETVDSILNTKGASIIFTTDKHGRAWKLFKKDNQLYVQRDYMLENDSIIFENETTALIGTIIDISENSIIVEGETFELTQEDLELDESAAKWIGMAALMGLLGLGAGQLLDTGAPEKTPLGQALAQAAKKDPYAAKELRNLGKYIELGDWDKIAQLNDTYLNVKYDNRYLAANPQVSFGKNWSTNTLTGKAVKGALDAVDENQAANIINKTFGAMADSISSSTIRRAGMLAMQGRYAEAEGAMRQHLAKLAPDVAKKVQDSIKNIKPVTVNGKVADTASLEKSKQHTDWLDNTFVPWVLKITSSKINEAEYKGREVKLGKPMRGDVKKFKVYVRDPKTGNIKKVNFGDKGMEIKRDDPKRRKSYRARHGCGTPRASDRTKAAYWSCRMWSSKPVSKIVKED